MSDVLDEAKAKLLDQQFDGSVPVYLALIISEIQKLNRHVSENKVLCGTLLEQNKNHQSSLNTYQQTLDEKLKKDFDKESKKIKVWLRFQNKRIRRLTVMTFILLVLCIGIGAQTNPEATKSFVEIVSKAGGSFKALGIAF